MVSIKSYITISTESKELNRVQDHVSNAFDQLRNSPLLDGTLHKSIPITAGTAYQLKHKLNRNLVGWIVTNNNANSVIWRTSSTVLPESILELNASATATIDVFVF
tara:strand:+ start:608 stop:925 length:318 start_codon:yes stop_codon:yes gene_type:complete